MCSFSMAAFFGNGACHSKEVGGFDSRCKDKGGDEKLVTKYDGDDD